ncbi:MAG: hypothetical protein ACYSW8_26035, partial [Planctomycetota bacterium]
KFTTWIEAWQDPGPAGKVVHTYCTREQGPRFNMTPEAAEKSQKILEHFRETNEILDEREL